MKQKIKLISTDVEAERLIQASPLLAFRDEVESCRQAFLQELESLPEPLNMISIEHYMRKVKRGDGHPMLGEYAPWLIANLAGISDQQPIEELMMPWLNIYTYIIFIDDAIDQQEMKDRELLLIAAGLLLERGLTKLSSLSFNTKNLLAQIDRYFTQTAIAAISELRKHRFSIKSYSDEELRRLGRKVAVLKLCAVYICSRRPVKNVGALNLKVIDALSTGIQILDDITDWEEDWHTGNYTFPLTLAFKKLHIMGIARALNPRKLRADEVLIAMVITGALAESLNRSTEFLEFTLSQVQDKVKHDSPAWKFLDGVVHNTEWFKSIVEGSRLVFEEERSVCRDSDWLKQLMGKGRVGRELYAIRKAFPIVAQRS